MAKENTRARRLKLIFGMHPKADQFYVTSDDQAFEKKKLADKHAETLRKVGRTGEVTLVKRSDVIGGKAAADAGKVPASKKDGKATETKVTGPDSREALATLHEELFGKTPAPNAKLETIKAKVEAEQARLSAEGNGAGSGEEPDAGEDQGSEEKE